MFDIALSQYASTAISLERAALEIGRLDMALREHPLLPAWTYRARIESAITQAAVDGYHVDRFRLGAMLEGLRLRLDHWFSMAERVGDLQGLSHAFEIVQVLAAPDDDQDALITAAEKEMWQQRNAPALIAAVNGLYSWVGQGGERTAARVAIGRYLAGKQISKSPLPCLCAAKSLHGDVLDKPDWTSYALDCLADEARNGRVLLAALEHAWLSARRAAATRVVKENSRLPAAVDTLAAISLISPHGLAALLKLSDTGATKLLREMQDLGIAVEVTGRKSRRLYAMKDLASMLRETTGPKKPVPGRGRGRPSKHEQKAPPPALEPPALPPCELRPKSDLPQIDYSALDALMLETDRAVRRAQRVLEGLSERQ